jgi:hypothetical protein
MKIKPEFADDKLECEYFLLMAEDDCNTAFREATRRLQLFKISILFPLIFSIDLGGLLNSFL